MRIQNGLLFAEHRPDNGSARPPKGGVAEFAAGVARQQAEYPAQALIHVKRAGGEPKPPYPADIIGSVVAHLHSQPPLMKLQLSKYPGMKWSLPGKGAQDQHGTILQRGT
jgi:hypothetical protein